MADETRVMVVGAGAWGTALAVLLAREGHQVSLWTRRSDHAERLQTERENKDYLPGVPLPDTLVATSTLEEAGSHDALLFAIPAQHARAYLAKLCDVSDGARLPVALCSKGLERGTFAPMHRVLKEVWPEADPAVLSGPSFAADVARGLPTAVTLAAEDEVRRNFWLDLLATSSFRPYASSDLLGAELGGAVKNVLAIACGIAEGKGFGESAKAALIARGFAEFQRYGLALGAQPETLGGLSGLGDLVLTANSKQSRNFSLGVAIGEGTKLEDYLGQQRNVAEGAATAGPLIDSARSKGINMPICAGIAAIIDDSADVDDVIDTLMNRPLRSEG
ncbi:MAG: NAD(P)H-dependent glycerol-3-phosphate dehydrogenase [Pseudomonadota bacterium]